MAESSEPPASATDKRILSGVRLLETLASDELDALARQCAWRRYALGERVFERGSDGREVFFVIEGAVNIVSFSQKGREIIFAAAEAGDTVGEMAAIDGQTRSASVVASDDSLLAVMSAETFVDLLERHGEIALRLLRQLSVMVRRADDRIVQLTSLKATKLIYAELLRLAEPDPSVPDLWVVKPLPPVRELAGRAGTTRELVVSSLNQLYPSGLIRRKGNSLYILDRTSLEQIVSSAGESDDR